MNRERKSRKLGWSTPVAIILLLVIGVGLFGVYLWEKRQQKLEADLYAEEEPFVSARTTLDYDGTEYTLRGDLDTYLLIGLDKYSETLSNPEHYTNNQQADFLFLVVVDKTNKSYSAIHLNRDAMTEITRLGMSGKKIGSFTGQLALSHTFGSGGKDSCRNTVRAVSGYLCDVPIEHYLSLTMDAIPILNDLVGGVEVYVKDDFSAIDPSLVQGQTIRLKGQQALTFVRTRYYVGDSSNLSRMERQQAYLDGLYKQITLKLNEDNGFGTKFASKLVDFSVSDLTTDELAGLAERLKDYTFTGIESIGGEAVRGEEYIEFYTDEADLQALVVRVFFTRARAR